MTDLRIRIKKKTDGSAALSCTRRDGSTTWQRQEGQLGRFFPAHDLTHFAVETTLGFDRAFYGLVAGGWDIADFGAPAMKPRVTDEALLAELLVGYFDLERATGELATARDINDRLAAHRADAPRPIAARLVTDDEVARIHALRAELLARWRALAPGDALELSFDRRHSAAATTVAAGG